MGLFLGRCSPILLCAWGIVVAGCSELRDSQSTDPGSPAGSVSVAGIRTGTGPLTPARMVPAGTEFERGAGTAPDDTWHPSAFSGGVSSKALPGQLLFGLPISSDCTGNDDCDSGFCVDGKCCDIACGGTDTSDCQACNAPGSEGTCTLLASGSVCRVSGGVCDVAEACDGSELCPADAKVTAGTACRGVNGDCDVAEACDGSSPACPLDTFKTSGECRAAGGACDVAESCDGTSASCPSDAKLAAGTVCRGAIGVCDVTESCDGTSPTCPNNAYKTSGVCRLSVGGCDAAESCDGTSPDCPIDGKRASGFVCRAANGLCDVAETCDGTADSCPSDAYETSGVCRSAAGGCDVAESCDGTSANCPSDLRHPNGFVCRASGGDCDVAETCDGSSATCPGDAKRPTGSVCRAAAGVCDLPESCDGWAVTCPGDAKRPASYVCRAVNGLCDVAENCDGSDLNCPVDGFKASGATCRSAVAVCDVAETCDGNSGACPTDVKKPSGTACRAAAGPCDVTEACDGVSTVCPSDAKVPNGTVCRASAGVCDVAETCNGFTNNCPNDAFVGSSTQCRAPSCTTGTAILAANCPGNGPACPAQQTAQCTPYLCSGTGCGTSCVDLTQCIAGDYCEAGKCKPKKPNGQACQTNDACVSQHCVDGYCCNQACAGQCQACDVAGSLGICTPVLGSPHALRPKCANDGSACGGACNGVVAVSCIYPAYTTQCRAPSCLNNTATLGAACNGTGLCPAMQTQSCLPFSCLGNQCGGDCQTDGNCAAGNYCSAGVCSPKLNNGKLCGAPNQCKSGFCVDTVCCNGPCNGQCEACDVNPGTCAPVVGAPHGSMRPPCATDGTACGGACDGVLSATCKYPSTPCRAASCLGGVATLGASCDGSGLCPAEKTQNCDPYQCDDTKCGGTCTLDTHCVWGSHCSGGVCKKKLGLGELCSGHAECQSGYCVDTVCCNTACVGQCEGCNEANQAGTCVSVSGAPRSPRTQCFAEGDTCGGACDGNHANGCMYPDGSVVCKPGSCTDNVAILPGYCNGIGACPAQQTQVCSPYLCDGSQCGGDCQQDTECALGNFCSAGVCKAKLELGESCGGNNQCVSGFCRDKVCCASTCSGQCEACDNAGNKGHCSAVVGSPHGGKPACAGTGVCQARCDGESTSECVYPDDATECADPYCADGIQTLVARCDGKGTCPQGKKATCGNYGCGKITCNTSCGEPGDCAFGFECLGTTCVAIDGGIEAGAQDGSAAGDAKADTKGNLEAGADSNTGADANQTAAMDEAAGDTGGCGCRTAQGGHGALGVLFGLLMLLGARRRRGN